MGALQHLLAFWLFYLFYEARIKRLSSYRLSILRAAPRGFFFFQFERGAWSYFSQI